MISRRTLTTRCYPMEKSSVFPGVLDPEGCYPYTQFSKTSERSEEKLLNVLVLENEHLCATICPDLGGRLLSLIHKATGKEALYRNDVIKPNRILPRWGWFSGGIEFNFPIAHSPTCLEPVGWHVFESESRDAVQVGETERKFGLGWIVELSLGKNDDFLTQRTFIRNTQPVKRPWCYWVNAAVRSTPETKYLFPASDQVFIHSDQIGYVSWPESGKCEKDFTRMAGLFWEAKGNAFGVWHPEEGVGLLHLADPKIVKGMKLWTYGMGKHAHWPKLFTDDGRPYAEIQSGAMADQNEMLYLEPGEQRSYIEFWKPILEEVAIHTQPLPEIQGNFPPCRWIGNEHIKELEAWNAFLDAYETGELTDKNRLVKEVPNTPPPPLVEYEQPLVKAYALMPDLWREVYATYLVATQQQARAFEILAKVQTAGELRLKGLLFWKYLNTPHLGAPLLQRALALSDDVQLACELDQILVAANLPDQRAVLFEQFQSQDQRWVERQCDFLLCQGNALAAKELLLQTTWDMYHLRAVRTNLYKRCQRALGLAQEPIPESLGEDDMADWGAYRPQKTL